MKSRKRNFRKTISIMVMVAMLITTMIPTWAFGTEAEPSEQAQTVSEQINEATTELQQETSEQDLEAEQAEETSAEQEVATETEEDSSGNQTESNTKSAATAEHFIKIQAPIDVGIEEIFKTTGDYMETLGTPTVNSIGGEWMVLGLVRSGRDVPEGYYDNVVAYVKEKINEAGQLHASKSTDNSRVILALTAAGIDARDVAGYDLLEALTDLNYVKKQGVNGPIWALIALDSHDDYDNVASRVRSDLLDTILDMQHADGGWSLTLNKGAASDADLTAMAIQALAQYYNTTIEIKTAVDKAVAFLSETQNSDGGFGSVDGASAESCSQVIVALTALKIDPATDSRFVKGGNSVIDALKAFYVDGGGFKHTKTGSRNGMATEQGYYALAAYDRFVNGKTALYDISDVEIAAGTASGEEPGKSDDGTDDSNSDDASSDNTSSNSAKDKSSSNTASVTKAVTKSASIKLNKTEGATDEELAEGKENHYDKATGIDVRDNSNDILPWYIKLNVVKQEVTDEQKIAVSETLGGEGEIFVLNDICFTNTKDGSEWQPTKPIKIKIPMVDIGDYENAVIVHITDTGKIELINGSIKEGMIEFETDSFSLYGLAGTNASINDLLAVEDDGEAIWPWILIGVLALAAVCYLIYRRRDDDKDDFDLTA